MVEEYELKVAQYHKIEKDFFWHSKAYLSRKLLKEFNFSSGDAIEIIGKTSTVAIIGNPPKDVKDKNLHIDKCTRINAGTPVGKYLKIKAIQLIETYEVIISPIFHVFYGQTIDISKNLEESVIKYLKNCSVVVGDVLTFPFAYFGNESIPFAVMNTNQDIKPVKVTKETNVIIEPIINVYNYNNQEIEKYHTEFKKRLLKGETEKSAISDSPEGFSDWLKRDNKIINAIEIKKESIECPYASILIRKQVGMEVIKDAWIELIRIDEDFFDNPTIFFTYTDEKGRAYPTELDEGKYLIRAWTEDRISSYDIIQFKHHRETEIRLFFENRTPEEEGTISTMNQKVLDKIIKIMKTDYNIESGSGINDYMQQL